MTCMGIIRQPIQIRIVAVLDELHQRSTRSPEESEILLCDHIAIGYGIVECNAIDAYQSILIAVLKIPARTYHAKICKVSVGLVYRFGYQVCRGGTASLCGSIHLVCVTVHMFDNLKTIERQLSSAPFGIRYMMVGDDDPVPFVIREVSAPQVHYPNGILVGRVYGVDGVAIHLVRK